MVSDSSTDGARGHRSRAPVLDGFGPVGRAWELGLMDGFARQGIDLGIADLIIGASAGAVVGARLKQGFGASPTLLPPLRLPGLQFIPTPWPIWAPLPCRAVQSSEPELICAENGVEILQHGEACLWNEPVSGRLRRPTGNANRPRALSSLDRARERPDRQRVRSPHVRGDALLGRRPFWVERRATRVRGGVAPPTEVGRVAFVEVTRPHSCHSCIGVAAVLSGAKLSFVFRR
jgi:hypothetical protein